MDPYSMGLLGNLVKNVMRCLENMVTPQPQGILGPPPTFAVFVSELALCA